MVLDNKTRYYNLEVEERTQISNGLANLAENFET